jgi:ribosomal protein S12 methylthiotransferase
MVTTDDSRIITTGGYYEYLKIAEGCDKHCTYCIIPKVRGNFRSYPMEYLLKQANELVDMGVKELILVAQETTMYGTDLYGRKCLGELLHKLAQIPELKWIRILYCYPEEIDDSLIEAIKTEPKVCHYIDMPIQHSSDNILKRMGRRTSRQELIDIIEKLRREIPDIAIRTTLITGFPGETEEDHEDMLDFIDMMEFDRLGVFTYSAEEDTPAATMPNQIPEDVKEARRDAVMELQQEISADKSQDMIGRTIDCMIEGKIEEDETYAARSYRDAPNVDGYVFIETDAQLMSGDIVSVKIDGATEYDLVGKLN